MSGKLVLVVLMAGLLAAALVSQGRGGVALADGGPHIATGSDATPDRCASCHRIHTAETDTLLTSGPTEMDFCYTCHGTGGTGSDLDVQGGKQRSNNSALRAGGFDFASINTTDPAPDSIGVLGTAQAVTSWHTADGTTAGTLWGNGALNSGAGPSFTLRCSACHDPHGNGQYRILRPIPAGSGATEPANVTDEADPKVYSTTNYFEPGPVSGIQMSSWCATCHTRYLASSTASSGDAIFANRHVSDGTSGRSCTKCHASHGTNAGASGTYSSVGYPGGGRGTTNTAESRLLKMDNRGICIKCHTEVLALTVHALEAPAPTPAAVMLQGDADCDGKVNSADAFVIVRDVAGLNGSSACLAAGDIDCDGERTSLDALGILRYVAHLSVDQPAGCPPIGAARTVTPSRGAETSSPTVAPSPTPEASAPSARGATSSQAS